MAGTLLSTLLYIILLMLTKNFQGRYCYPNFKDQKAEAKLGSRTQLGGNSHNTYNKRLVSRIHKELLEVNKKKTNITWEKNQSNEYKKKLHRRNTKLIICSMVRMSENGYFHTLSVCI